MRALDDDMHAQILRHLHARSSKNAAAVNQRWLALSQEEWRRRARDCVAAEGLDWKPSLAKEIEHFENCEDGDRTGWKDHKKAVRELPFVLGLYPAPSAAMWAFTKPTAGGADQVYLDTLGAERNDGTWGCNESVCSYGNDSNWNRGFCWGVMAFDADEERSVGCYPVPERPADVLDTSAIVSQYPLPLSKLGHGTAFLGSKIAVYNSGLGERKPIPYCIGGRLLRMASGSSEEGVMVSLGFLRNPSVAESDYASEARWCRLPTVNEHEKCQVFSAAIVPVVEEEDDEHEGEDEDSVSGSDSNEEATEGCVIS